MGSRVGRPAGRPGGLGRLLSRRRGKAPTVQPARVNQPLADPSIHEADNPLLSRLQDVYVDSTSTTVTQDNPFASEVRKKTDNLPQDRRVYSGDIFTVDHSSDGHLTYAEVLDILNKRESEEKGLWTPETVAKQYKIKSIDAENLMNYFSAYKMSSSEK